MSFENLGMEHLKISFKRYFSDWDIESDFLGVNGDVGSRGCIFTIEDEEGKNLKFDTVKMLFRCEKTENEKVYYANADFNEETLEYTVKFPDILFTAQQRVYLQWLIEEGENKLLSPIKRKDVINSILSPDMAEGGSIYLDFTKFVELKDEMEEIYNKTVDIGIDVEAVTSDLNRIEEELKKAEIKVDEITEITTDFDKDLEEVKGIFATIKEIEKEIDIDVDDVSKNLDEIKSIADAVSVDKKEFDVSYADFNEKYLKVENVVDAEEQRINAEEQRKINESERQLKEENRIFEENERIDNEALRKKQELERTNSETIRVKNEDERRDAEGYRKDEETQRQWEEEQRQEAESLRATFEDNRISMEAIRVEVEEKRRANEIERQEAEAQRKLNEEARNAGEQSREERFDSMVDKGISEEVLNRLEEEQKQIKDLNDLKMNRKRYQNPIGICFANYKTNVIELGIVKIHKKYASSVLSLDFEKSRDNPLDTVLIQFKEAPTIDPPLVRFECLNEEIYYIKRINEGEYKLYAKSKNGGTSWFLQRVYCNFLSYGTFTPTMVLIDELPEGCIKATRIGNGITKSELMAEVNILNGKINDKIVEQDNKFITKAEFAKLEGKERKLETLAGLILEELRKINPEIGPISLEEIIEHNKNKKKK